MGRGARQGTNRPLGERQQLGDTGGTLANMPEASTYLCRLRRPPARNQNRTGREPCRSPLNLLKVHHQ